MSTTTIETIQRPFLIRFGDSVVRRSGILLDQSTPHSVLRWLIFMLLIFLYGIRVYYLQGFYIVTYGLGIYLLNLFIGFLQPQDDLSIEEQHLPTKEKDEYRPFRRRVPEFRFWLSASKAVCVSMLMTFFSMFDIPVFWPILLLYFFVLLAITMKRQIKHMVKHKYIPFSWGKKKYEPGKTIKKQEPAGPMPKVRPPIRSMPIQGAQTLKKVNRD